MSDQLKVCRVWYVIVSLSKQPRRAMGTLKLHRAA